MKTIKIIIRVDEETGKFGFVLDRSKEEKENILDNITLLGALDILKDKLLKDMEEKQKGEMEYGSSS